MPDEPEVQGLLALMLLGHSRRAARVDVGGRFVPLAEQDRGRWDFVCVAEGQAIVRQCLRRNRPGPYQIQAAIHAVHSDAASASDTNWAQILQLYDHLVVVAPGPVVSLNRAVVVGSYVDPPLRSPSSTHLHLTTTTCSMRSARICLRVSTAAMTPRWRTTKRSRAAAMRWSARS